MIDVRLNDTWKLSYQLDEAYKALRTNLQFCGTDKKVIALTSCTPNEGKSNVSFHLAASIAESGKSVLLIDADLRNSEMLGRIESEEEIKGLAHFLSKQAKLSEVMCTTEQFKKFDIIFAGTFPPNPAELLGGGLFKGMINKLREVYDYIIIDTPPLGSVIDAAVVADSCDGSIIVIESARISYHFVQDVLAQLKKSNCPVIGTILNKVDYGKKGYGKYGKYGKYGHYGKYGKE